MLVISLSKGGIVWHAHTVVASILRKEVVDLLQGFMQGGKNVRIVTRTLTIMNTMKGAETLTHEVKSTNTDRNCREEGHLLEEVKAVMGYRCKSCEAYIREDNILKTSFGRCPKCDAPESKLTWDYWGSERIEYKCKNCGYSWRQLM